MTISFALFEQSGDVVRCLIETGHPHVLPSGRTMRSEILKFLPVRRPEDIYFTESHVDGEGKLLVTIYYRA